MSISNQLNANKRRKALELLNQNRIPEARSAYQSLVRQHPGDIEAWLMLGIISARLREIPAAEKCLQNALSVNQGFAEAWFVYGQILESQGRIDDAGRAFFKAVAADPRCAEAHAVLGRMFLDRSQFRRAMYHFEQALEIDVFRKQLMSTYVITRQKLMHMYGNSLRYGGKPREAVALYKSLLRKQPRDTELLQTLGSLCIQLTELDQARDYIKRGLDIAPDDHKLRVTEIRLLRLEKYYDEALDKARALFDTATDDLDVAMSFAGLCHRAGRCDAAIARLEELLQSGSFGNRKRAVACFELGRLYDAAGDFDRAFPWYRQGNELVKGAYDQAATRAAYDALIEGYSRDNLARASRAGNRDARPVFIVGMPRSGTSLVEQILASHPEVHGAGELTDIDYLMKGYRDKGSGTGRELVEQLRAECRDFSVDALDKMAGRYLEYIGSLASGTRYVTDKMPGNFYYLGPIALLFPAARIIHCRRNPIDTCLSCYFQNFAGFHPYSNDFKSLADFYRHYHRLMDHWKSVIDLPVLDVDYEALVGDQETETRRMLDFLDLEWDDRCLQYHRSERATLTASADQVNRPIYTSSVARWKRYRDHITPLIEALGEFAGQPDT